MRNLLVQGLTRRPLTEPAPDKAELELVELRDNGALGQIYAHLISLFGWDKLVAESLARRGETMA